MVITSGKGPLTSRLPRPATWGRTEEIVGRWLAQRGVRHNIVLASEAQITPAVLQAIDGLTSLAADHDCTLAQFAVAWTAAHPAVTTPIVGATRAAQLDETLKAVEVRLDSVALEQAGKILAEVRVG